MNTESPSVKERSYAMEILGVWRLKEMIAVDKGGFRMMSAEEIEDMEACDANRQFKCMLFADFILSEASLDIIYPLTDDPFAKEKGWQLTERGYVIDSFPARIEDGILMLDYIKNGEYTPVYIDDEGIMSLSGGLIKIKKT